MRFWLKRAARLRVRAQLDTITLSRISMGAIISEKGHEAYMKTLEDLRERLRE